MRCSSDSRWMRVENDLLLYQPADQKFKNRTSTEHEKKNYNVFIAFEKQHAHRATVRFSHNLTRTYVFTSEFHSYSEDPFRWQCDDKPKKTIQK